MVDHGEIHDVGTVGHADLAVLFGAPEAVKGHIPHISDLVKIGSADVVILPVERAVMSQNDAFFVEMHPVGGSGKSDIGTVVGFGKCLIGDIKDPVLIPHPRKCGHEAVEAICESPRPADKSRVLSYLGHLSKYEMRQVSVCLQYSFGFIGYKSFRKYLTAPPQEDVLAAAKELLSQQFQNLRVLNSQPPALAKHTKGDLHSIEQISERMLSTPTESSVEFMVAELDDALQSLMFRWNICYERYSSFRLSDNEKKKIGLIIQSGIDFLQKKKEVPL